jgi:urea transport system substrate-binding protein
MIRRSRFIVLILLLFGIGAALVVGAAAALQPAPIRVGILHSLSGTMAISETAVVDATILAIEQINAAGGVLGRPIEAVIADGESDWNVFAAEAERLINDEGVSVIFGCWTSACRKTVKPVFERLNHLLIYPVQYEGLEESPNIIYTGSAPNQQIIPAMAWTVENLGTRMFLVGSDYVFPRMANAIIRDHAGIVGGMVLAETYTPLGSTDMDAIIEAIRVAQPDVILNTINGDSNVAFFAALRSANITTPVLSFSVSESELASMDSTDMVGDYAAWTYFQSIDTPENAAFVAAFRARYGADRVTSDPMEAAYSGVYLWAAAVNEARTPDAAVIREAILNRSYLAPQGVIYIDGITRHTWKTVRIGQIRADGQFDVVWESGVPIRPYPYPDTRTPLTWQSLLDQLYARWGGWANPGGDS